MAAKTKQTEPDGEPAPIGHGDLVDWAEMFEPSPEAAFVGALGYAEKMLAPRALAEERRKAGDPSRRARAIMIAAVRFPSPTSARAVSVGATASSGTAMRNRRASGTIPCAVRWCGRSITS